MGAKIQPPNSVETPVKSDFSEMHFPQVNLFSEGNGELGQRSSIFYYKRETCSMLSVRGSSSRRLLLIYVKYVIFSPEGLGNFVSFEQRFLSRSEKRGFDWLIVSRSEMKNIL